MNRNRCSRCGLVNSESDESCRRCGASLTDQPAELDSEEAKPKRTFLRRLVWVLSTTVIILLGWYLSLLATSEGLSSERSKKVTDAIAVLEQSGSFSRQTFVLRNLASYRQTDNWWNQHVGHHDAYAATNFPFEIVTLYPQFFDKTVDDNERAAILLHEAFHLLGANEDRALEETWLNKHRLGWTEEKYGPVSEAWNNTKRLTLSRFPQFFTCGLNQQSDCF
jgi:hypothetical protein